VARDVDVVIDTEGGETQQRSWGVLKPGGILVGMFSPPSEDVAVAHGVRHHYFGLQCFMDGSAFTVGWRGFGDGAQPRPQTPSNYQVAKNLVLAPLQAIRNPGLQRAAGHDPAQVKAQPD
jgi:NADPH:quinone reductase-like Zn-dependent oxidoreductase